MKGGILNGRKIKSLLFDMDGVLVDSENAWLRAFNETLKNFGSQPVSEKEYLEKYSRFGSVPVIIGKMSEDLKNPLLDGKAVEYCHSRFSDFALETRLFPGAKEALEIARKSFRTGMVTNTKKFDVFRMMKALEIEKYFDVVVTVDDVSKGKPDPEIILKACSVLGTEPENTALVGDSVSDLEAGKSAGCLVIGVGMEADARISSVSELWDLLEKKA